MHGGHYYNSDKRDIFSKLFVIEFEIGEKLYANNITTYYGTDHMFTSLEIYVFPAPSY